MLSEYLLVGEVLKPQGVQGEVKVKPYTDNPHRFYDLKQVFVQNGAEYQGVKSTCTRISQGYCYMRLEGVDTREAAEAWRGRKLYVDRAHAVKLEEGQVFICDLIGCTAYDTKGNALGTLKDVLQNGPTDVYVFDTPKGEMMMPALKAAIPEVDVQEKRIVLNESKLQEVAFFAD